MELDVSMQDTFMLKVTRGLLASIWLPRECTSIDYVPIPKHRDLAVRAGTPMLIFIELVAVGALEVVMEDMSILRC